MIKRAMRLVALTLLLVLLMGCALAQGSALDYSDPENWAIYAMGEDHDADLFLLCPSVDRGRDGNTNLSLDSDVMKQKFVGALNMERGIYEDELTIYAPYYRQASFPMYFIPAKEAEPYFEIAYADVREAFLAFLEQRDADRPFVLAGFSQGSDMLLRLLKDFFDDPTLQEKMISAYCIGWRITEADMQECPWLKLAQGEDDLGSIICFTAEAEGIEGSVVVPEGVKTYAINPLNWKTDGTMADATLNLGACFTDYSTAITKEIPQMTGAYINEKRGTLIVPDVDPLEYPGQIFPEGIYHVYDLQFFYRNLQANVALRVETYRKSHS